MRRRGFAQKVLQIGLASGLVRSAMAASPRNVYGGLSPPAARALEEENLAKAISEINSLIEKGPFQATWESLHKHQDPEWFRDAKFGIYTHWGPVTVGSSYSPGDAEWYGNQMYKTGHPAFDYHKSQFGDQHTVGFKDLIPRFTGEKFNAEQWADVFVRSGAKFAGPVATHHDNFAL